MIDFEKFSEKIREKHEKDSTLSKRTIDETLETLAKIIKEDASEEDASALFDTLAGQVRKEKADFAKGYESKTPDKPKEEPKEEPKPGSADEPVPAWAKSLVEGLTSAQEKLANIEKAKTAETVKKEAFERAKMYPSSVLEDASDGFNFGEEGAGEKFIERVARFAQRRGITPEKADAKDTKPSFSELREKIDNEKNI